MRDPYITQIAARVRALSRISEEEKVLIQDQIGSILRSPELTLELWEETCMVFGLTPESIPKDWHDRRGTWPTEEEEYRQGLLSIALGTGYLTPGQPLVAAVFERVEQIVQERISLGPVTEDHYGHGDKLFAMLLSWPHHSRETLRRVWESDTSTSCHHVSWQKMLSNPACSPELIAQALVYGNPHLNTPPSRVEEVRRLLEAGGHLKRLTKDDVRGIVDHQPTAYGRRCLLLLLMRWLPETQWPDAAWAGRVFVPQEQERALMHGASDLVWTRQLSDAMLSYIGASPWGPMLADSSVSRETRITVVTLLGRIRGAIGRPADVSKKTGFDTTL